MAGEVKGANVMPDDKDSPTRPQTELIGVGVAIGAGVGAALFAATGDAFWIGVGAGVGAALGAGVSAKR